jgi:2-polyprenyl-3-methyl-5-hydroxy-6-metoxy-1,4-benzoquinol methylase
MIDRETVKNPSYWDADWFVREYAKVNDDPWGLTWRPSQKIRYLHTLGLLDKVDRPIKCVLDIGCATGDVTYLLSKKYAHSSIVGIDFIEEAVRRAQKRYTDLRFECRSIFDVGRAFKEEADLVLCLEVLYYIDNTDHLRALDAVKCALRDGGYALFSSLRGEVPYLSLEALKKLVSQRFTLVGEKTVYVTPLSKVERLGMKFDKLGQRLGWHWLSSSIRILAEAFPLRMAQRIEKASSTCFGELAASHSIVLAQK